MTAQLAVVPRVEVEEWRDVPGLPGFMASSRGRIAKLQGSGTGTKNGKYRYLEITARQTMESGLAEYGSKRNDCENYRISAHHIVAVTFLGPPPEGKTQVNHKDNDGTNNHPNNLEWCDQGENLQHAWDLNVRRNQGLKKYDETAYREARRLFNEEGLTYGQVAERMKDVGMTHGGAQYIIRDSRRFR